MKAILAIFFAVCTVLGLALSSAEGVVVIRQLSGNGACGVSSAKLNHEVEPERYRVSLHLTDLKADQFDGETEIHLKAMGNKKGLDNNLNYNKIFLNADESIDIEEVRFRRSNKMYQMAKMRGTKVEVVGACLNTDLQVLVVTLSQDLLPGERGKLSFRYKAKYGKVGLKRAAVSLNNKRSLHLSFSGEQFARRVFPSFDDPSFPARFALEVTCPAALKPLSNEVSDVDEDKVTSNGNKVNKFALTGKIATKDLVMSLLSD